MFMHPDLFLIYICIRRTIVQRVRSQRYTMAFSKLPEIEVDGSIKFSETGIDFRASMLPTGSSKAWDDLVHDIQCELTFGDRGDHDRVKLLSVLVSLFLGEASDSTKSLVIKLHQLLVSLNGPIGQMLATVSGLSQFREDMTSNPWFIQLLEQLRQVVERVNDPLGDFPELKQMTEPVFIQAASNLILGVMGVHKWMRPINHELIAVSSHMSSVTKKREVHEREVQERVVPPPEDPQPSEPARKRRKRRA